jgi:hypothetical protein
MADIDRLMQVDEVAGLPQAVEELTEILLHPLISKKHRARVVRGLFISY